MTRLLVFARRTLDTPGMPMTPTRNASVPDLIPDTRHKHAPTRLAAVKALGKLAEAPRDSLPALYAALQDLEPKVREAAAAAFGAFGPAALPFLVAMLGHADKYVRRNAVWALGRLGPPAQPAVAELCRALRDADPRTASGAAQALGSIGAAEAVSPLAEAMRGTNVVLCRLAAKALSQIGPPALPTLVAHLRHHDPFVRGEAAVALGWMGPEAAATVMPLVELLHPRAAREAFAETPAPSPGLTPPTGAIPAPAGPPPALESSRVAAVTALGRIGPAAAAARPFLEHCAAADPSPAVRAAAVVSLRQLS